MPLSRKLALDDAQIEERAQTMTRGEPTKGPRRRVDLASKLLEVVFGGQGADPKARI